MALGRALSLVYAIHRCQTGPASTKYENRLGNSAFHGEEAAAQGVIGAEFLVFIIQATQCIRTSRQKGKRKERKNDDRDTRLREPPTLNKSFGAVTF